MTNYDIAEAQPILIARIIKMLGPKGLLTWALLVGALGCVMYGIADVVYGLEFGFLFLIAVPAMTLGWLLALLPMRGWMAATFSALFGVEIVVLRVGRLGGAVLDLVQATATLIWQVITWYWNGTPDWWVAPKLFMEIWINIGALVNRAREWLWALVAGPRGFDPVGAALVWGLAVWLCAIWAGWVVSRDRRPLLGILPGSAILTFALSYTGGSSLVLLPLIGLTLLLMALMYHRERELRWAHAGIDFSRDLWDDVIATASAVSLVLMLLASVAPSISAQKLWDIVDWVRDMTSPAQEQEGETIGESLGLQQQPQTREMTPLERASTTDLPRSNLIGSGPELSRIVVMVISTGELPAVPFPDVLPRQPTQYYWRGVTYDRYLGRGWSTSRTEESEYGAGDQAIWPDVPYHRLVRQTVQVVGDVAGVVHVAGELVAVDQDYKVAWRPPNELFGATTKAETYRADSIVPVVTEEELRGARTVYPTWILERYLQLPTTVPERVLALARDLTALEPTPYDRAIAIESYLREFPYTLDVSASPFGRDMVDYFLFDLQKGYCGYYASAMVVLARAAGLPARLVMGYAPGTYDVPNARYIVTEADSHAWPEIYFPEYGWINFEPTGGYPPLERSTEEEPIIWPEGKPLAPLVNSRAGPRIVLGQWLLGGLALVLAAVFGSTGIEAAVLLWRTPEATATRLYRRLRRYARRLKVKATDGDTPYELADAFIDRLREIALDRRAGEAVLAPAVKELSSLVELYVRTWYTPCPVASDEQRTAVWTWSVLRWRLWLAWLWRRPRRERPPMPGASAPRSGDTLPRLPVPPM